MKYTSKIIVFILIVFAVVFVSEKIGFNFDDEFITDKYLELSKVLEDNEKYLDVMESKISENNIIVSSIELEKQKVVNDIEEAENTISYYKQISGFTDLRGSGITVKINDNLSSDYYSMNDKIVHNIDILSIINDLNVNEAEAISINGKRIVSSTEVSCIGPVIRINGEAQGAPFIIKAIGKPSELAKAMTDEDSYAYFIRENFGIDISTMKNLDIYIGKNTDELNYEYIEILKE